MASVRLLASISRLRGLPSSCQNFRHASLLCPAEFHPPKSVRRSPVGFMMSEHWPRGTLVTRLYEGGSFALSLIRLSGETRAHRSRTTLRFVYVGLRPRSGSAHPAFLTVCRLLYSADLAHHPASSAEFCSAYLTLESPESPLVFFSSPVIRHPVCRRHRSRPFAVRRHPLKKRTNSVVMPAAVSLLSRAQDFSRAEHFPQFVQLSASRQSRTSGQSGEAPSR